MPVSPTKGHVHRDREQLASLMQEFIKQEPVFIENTMESFKVLLNACLPRMQAYAVETGRNSGRVVIEMDYCVDTRTPSAVLRANIIPPPAVFEVPVEFPSHAKKQ
jgi:hypothetical protein